MAINGETQSPIFEKGIKFFLPEKLRPTGTSTTEYAVPIISFNTSITPGISWRETNETASASDYRYAE